MYETDHSPITIDDKDTIVFFSSDLDLMMVLLIKLHEAVSNHVFGYGFPQLDLLYEEAVYTVVNRVGVPSPEYVAGEGEIFSYLLKVTMHIRDCHHV